MPGSPFTTPGSVLPAVAAGVQYDYAELNTGNVNITPTSDATAAAVITGSPITLDGNTRIRLDFSGGANIPAGNEIVFVVYDGATDLGRLCFYSNQAASNAIDAFIAASRFFTPAAGTHTFQIAAWRVVGSSVPFVYGGAGGAGVPFPSWYRVTQA